MKLALVLLFGLFLNACATGGGGGSSSPGAGADDDRVQKYGEKVSYEGGRELKFPDLSIRFLGRREEKISNDILFPQKMTFYDFEVARGGDRKKISWSSGTGDIVPTFFEIGGAEYVLELSRSEIIRGPLGEGNLVLWTGAGYAGS